MLPLGRGVTVLAHDGNGVGALNKPAGVLSIPNREEGDGRSLLAAAYEEASECFHWPEGRLWLLNRLDSATSGVILVAASAELAQAIRAQFRRREIGKVYQALVFGRPRAAEERWRDRLAVDKSGGRIRTSAGNIPAESAMKLIRSWPAARGLPALSLLQLEPRTGRSHQLRVQCARRRLPIVGDQTYGDFPLNRAFAKLAGSKRLMLHSLRTQLTYERGGRAFTFAAEAPLPAEFEPRLGPA